MEMRTISPAVNMQVLDGHDFQKQPARLSTGCHATTARLTCIETCIVNVDQSARRVLKKKITKSSRLPGFPGGLPPSELLPRHPLLSSQSGGSLNFDKFLGHRSLNFIERSVLFFVMKTFN